MKFRLYVGLERGGQWYNYTEVEVIKGGGLAVLDGADKSGAARFLSLLEKSCFKFFTEDGQEYELKKSDYLDIKVVDTWKIAIEAMKTITGQEKFIIPENFHCSVCSQLGQERYTKVEECWQDLIDEGLIDEYYLEDSDCTYITELPVGFEILDKKTQTSRQFNNIIRQPITLGDMLKIQKSNFAQASEANMIFALWDASIVDIEGMTKRELNIYVKRNSQDSFTKKYLTDMRDHEALEESANENKVGIDASYRPVSCQYCNSEIGGLIDFTNFFQGLLPRSSRKKSKV